jgi:hypothetical protein
MYSGEERRYIEAKLRLNTQQIQPASLIDSKLLQEKFTGYAITKMKEQLDQAEKYTVIVTEGPHIARVQRCTNSMVIIPGQLSENEYRTCDLETWSCSCGFTVNMLMICRHIIAAVRKVTTLSVYEVILKTTHARWTKNAAADIQDFGMLVPAYEQFAAQFVTASDNNASWTQYITPKQRFNAVRSLGDHIGNRAQHSTDLYEYAMRELYRITSFIENPSIIPQRISSTVHDYKSTLTNADSELSNTVTGSDENKAPVRDPVKSYHAGRGLKRTNGRKRSLSTLAERITCSSCNQLGHNARNLKCPKRDKYERESSSKRRKNELDRSSQTKYYQQNYGSLTQ